MKKPLSYILFFLFFSTLAQESQVDELLSRHNEYMEKSDFDSALSVSKKSLQIAQQLDNELLQAKSLIAIANAHFKKGEITQAKSIGQKALSISQKVNEPILLMDAYLVLGNVHYRNFKDPEAIIFYQKIDSLAEKHQLNNKTLLKTYNNLGSLFWRNDDFNLKKIAFYYQKAYDSAFALKDDKEKYIASTYLASVLAEEKKESEALEVYLDAYNYFKSTNNIKELSNILWSLGGIYEKIKNFEKAESSFLENIQINSFSGNNNGLARANWVYGGYLYRNLQFEKSISVLQAAQDNFEKEKTIDVGPYTSTIYMLAEAHKQTGNYKQAYNFIEKAWVFNDSIIASRNEIALEEIETKYQTEKKEQEIALLTAQKELEAKQKANQRNLFLALLGIILIASGFIFYAYRNKLKTAQKLKELDTLKSRFFANISHEFRTPLTLIKSPLQSVMEAETSEEKTQKLQLVNQNANRMLELVDQLLELSKLDSGSLKPILKKANLGAFIKTFIAPFQYEAEQKNIQFSSKININPKEHWFDRDILEKITANLLSNALKYTPENEKVHIGASVENNQLKIQVQNTGNTLSKAETSKIFERFYQKNENSPGAGIGLALVKELVELYKGTVDVENQHGALTFNVMLPLDKEVLKGMAIITEETEVAIQTNTEFASDEDAPLLLIADDNAAIRQVVADIFSSEYKILEAVNGKEALKIAKKEVPDLVISDVMMPEMDGFELTNTLKNDEVTSFIPIVLLTAKTGDEAHLQGLKNQADAFLTKPFNNQLLKAKVQQLLAERGKLRQRFSKELVLKPMDVVLSSADEKFMAKLQTIIDEKLQNPDFSAEIFADTVGMSRMQLHRKLKSLTGFSATEFIRKERLKMAAALLKNKTLNVSEIAFAVGFNDADYFTKCFKEAFGVTPSQFS